MPTDGPKKMVVIDDVSSLRKSVQGTLESFAVRDMDRKLPLQGVSFKFEFGLGHS